MEKVTKDIEKKFYKKFDLNNFISNLDFKENFWFKEEYYVYVLDWYNQKIPLDSKLKAFNSFFDEFKLEIFVGEFPLKSGEKLESINSMDFFMDKKYTHFYQFTSFIIFYSTFDKFMIFDVDDEFVFACSKKKIVDFTFDHVNTLINHGKYIDLIKGYRSN
ncbi:hypothetical protein [Pontimicrobium aquaticum]|uniref:Uncharacterized protein n=1 Tax=Pontimicrobium aquaticum TaxID=2565367 RepID=A0A4U0EZA2_9FLAO|nr:hypothetical protein [Pontimicrobium aquaticum]TJY37387.1 hypothetical protein E5167_05425 [Pontimicrobium aquaticum]